ncbi:hypothetical protein ACKKBF_B11295 [Auxenochlorella protothecoides x Auxenochlorella symbiontica]
MSGLGLKIPRLDLSSASPARSDASPRPSNDASARGNGSSARSRLHAITERVLAGSTGDKTPRLSARGSGISRLSVRASSTQLTDAPPTSRREGNTSRRSKAEDSLTTGSGSVMQRATFLDALITARRASGGVPTPRSSNAGPAATAPLVTPLPPRLAVAHLTSTPGSLTSRPPRLEAAPRATPRGAGAALTSRGVAGGSFRAGVAPGPAPAAAVSVGQLAELAARRRAAAAQALELQAAAAAARSASAARKADLADMEVAHTALAAELASLRCSAGEKSATVFAARKALLETMKAAAALLQLGDVQAALAGVALEAPPTASPTGTPLANGQRASFRAGSSGPGLSPGALHSLTSLGSKLSAAESLLLGGEEVDSAECRLQALPERAEVAAVIAPSAVQGWEPRQEDLERAGPGRAAEQATQAPDPTPAAST